MYHDSNSTFHYLGLCLCLLILKQDASPMVEFGSLGAKVKNRVQPPPEIWGEPPALCHCILGWRPPVTSANLAFSSRWKGENVATTEVADVVGLVDFVQEVNVYGVPVPGMHHILQTYA